MVPLAGSFHQRRCYMTGLQAIRLFSEKYMKDAAGLARGGDETKVGVCIK